MLVLACRSLSTLVKIRIKVTNIIDIYVNKISDLYTKMLYLFDDIIMRYSEIK
jgi:hypothetical protein